MLHLFRESKPAILWKPINHFPTAVSIPWQASGPGDSDEAYIAILGDSYAAGFGDWSVETGLFNAEYLIVDLGIPTVRFM